MGGGRFGPDGKWFAAASVGTLSVYDAATLDVRWHEPQVLQGVFAVSPDGKRLACSVIHPTLGHGVRVIDLTGAAPRAVKNFAFRRENGTKAITFGHDGKTLVTGTGTGGVYFWDLDGPEGQQPAKVVSGDSGMTERDVFQVWVSSDGKRLIEGRQLGAKRTVVVWDVDGLKQTGEIAGIITFVVSPQEDRLVALRLENAASEIEAWRLDGPVPIRVAGPVRTDFMNYAGPISPDGREVFLAGIRGSVFWELGDGRLAKARGLPAGVVAVSPDLSRMVTAGYERFAVLDRDGKVLVEPGTHLTMAGAPVGAGGRIYTFAPGPRAWTVRDGGLAGEEVTVPDEILGHSGMIGATDWADGRRVAGLGRDLVVRVLALEPGGWRTQSRIMPDLGSPAGRPSGFLPHPDGKRLVTRYEDGSLGVWDVTAEPPTRTATWPKAGAFVELAPTGDVVADLIPAEVAGSVGLRRPGEPKAARSIPGVPDESTLGAGFAPDGRFLHVGYTHKDTERVRRYDLTKKTPVGEVVWERPARYIPGDPFHRFEFSRDGTRLLGCTQMRLYVLDAASRAELMSLDLHHPFGERTGALVRWADDGRHVLLGQHGCVYVLRVPDKPTPTAGP